MTLPTGRGMSVVDFFSMHQTKQMMREIFKFFRSKNPASSSIESVIIDKDVKEWDVLNEIFPSAKVGLCIYEYVNG